MRLSSARGLQDAAPLFDETGRAVRRRGPPGDVSADGQVARFAPAGSPQRAMASRRANDGFPSSGHLRIEFFLLPGFRAVAGQVDGEVGELSGHIVHSHKVHYAKLSAQPCRHLCRDDHLLAGFSFFFISRSASATKRSSS
jgi:hypothetical protein